MGLPQNPVTIYLIVCDQDSYDAENIVNETWEIMKRLALSPFSTSNEKCSAYSINEKCWCSLFALPFTPDSVILKAAIPHNCLSSLWLCNHVFHARTNKWIRNVLISIFITLIKVTDMYCSPTMHNLLWQRLRDIVHLRNGFTLSEIRLSEKKIDQHYKVNNPWQTRNKN